MGDSCEVSTIRGAPGGRIVIYSQPMREPVGANFVNTCEKGLTMPQPSVSDYVDYFLRVLTPEE